MSFQKPLPLALPPTSLPCDCMHGPYKRHLPPKNVCWTNRCLISDIAVSVVHSLPSRHSWGHLSQLNSHKSNAVGPITAGASTLVFISSSLSSGSALRVAAAGSTNPMGAVPLATPLGRAAGLAGDGAAFWGLGLGMAAAGWEAAALEAGAVESFCMVAFTDDAASFIVLATLPPMDDNASLAAPAVELPCAAVPLLGLLKQLEQLGAVTCKASWYHGNLLEYKHWAGVPAVEHVLPAL